MKSSQRHFLVRAEGIPGLFSTKTGGEITSNATKNYDGGSTRPDVLTSPPEVGDITIGRGYDHERDAGIVRLLRNSVGTYQTTVSVTPTNRDMEALDDAETYPNATLVGFTPGDVDASSGEISSFALTFAIEDWV